RSYRADRGSAVFAGTARTIQTRAAAASSSGADPVLGDRLPRGGGRAGRHLGRRERRPGLPARSLRVRRKAAVRAGLLTWKNLTPRPPSLGGKGETSEAPPLLGEGLGRGFHLTPRCGMSFGGSTSMSRKFRRRNVSAGL